MDPSNLVTACRVGCRGVGITMDFHARPGFARAGVPDDATDDLARLNHEDGFRPVQHGRGQMTRKKNNDRALLGAVSL